MRSRLPLARSQRSLQFLAQPLIFLPQALNLFAQLLVLALRRVQVLLGNKFDGFRRVVTFRLSGWSHPPYGSRNVIFCPEESFTRPYSEAPS